MLVMLPVVVSAGALHFCNTPVEKAISLIEKQTGYTIIYNPRHLKTVKPVSGSYSGSAVQMLGEILGEGYDVKVKNKIITIKPAKRKPVVKDTVIEPVVENVADTVVSDIIVEAPLFEYTAVSPVVQPLAMPKITVVDTLQKMQPVRLPAVRNSSPHALMLGYAMGCGFIDDYGVLVNQLDLSYGYFFHRHWAASLGLGIDDYGKNGADTTDRLLTFAIPVMLYLSYPVSAITSFKAAAGVSFCLPISGTYAYDDGGSRYSNSLLYNIKADLGASFRLSPHFSLAIAAYGQYLLGTTGSIVLPSNSEWTFHPGWQVGARVTVSFRFWVRGQEP